MSDQVGSSRIAADSAPQLYTVRDAAERLAMSTDRVRQLLAAGDIAGLRDGRIIKISADEIARYAQQLPPYGPGVGA